MKRILLTLLKLINSYTNHQITAKEEAGQILKYMLLKSDTKRVIEVYKALNEAIEQEMDNRAFEALRTAKLWLYSFFLCSIKRNKSQVKV